MAISHNFFNCIRICNNYFSANFVQSRYYNQSCRFYNMAGIYYVYVNMTLVFTIAAIDVYNYGTETKK